MVGNGSALVKMTVNGWTLLACWKWLDMAGMAGYGWNQLDWLEMAGNLLEMD